MTLVYSKVGMTGMIGTTMIGMIMIMAQVIAIVATMKMMMTTQVQDYQKILMDERNGVDAFIQEEIKVPAMDAGLLE